jgi:PAS domain-containing protein
MDHMQKIATNLDERARILSLALSNMRHGLLMLDESARIVVCNQRYIEMYGLSPEVVKAGSTLHEVMRHSAECGSFSGDPEDFCASTLQRIGKGSASSILVKTVDGRMMNIIERPVPGGGWVVTHNDVSECTQAQARIAHLTRHDSLTNLPNRTQFHESLEQVLGWMRRGGGGNSHCSCSTSTISRR